MTQPKYLFLLISLLLFGCGGEEQSPVIEETASYDVRGIYVTTDYQNLTVTILHEAIPDVMNAMRMSLRLDNSQAVEDLERGDKISFRLARVGMQWYARDIELLPEGTELELPDELRGSL